MSRLAKIALVSSVLALGYTTWGYSYPAVNIWLDVRYCQEDGWVTDTCVEMPQYREHKLDY